MIRFSVMLSVQSRGLRNAHNFENTTCTSFYIQKKSVPFSKSKRRNKRSPERLMPESDMMVKLQLLNIYQNQLPTIYQKEQKLHPFWKNMK